MYENRDDESSSSDWDSAEEINDDDDESATNCLFCNQIYKNVNDTLTHMKDVHEFDLIKLCAENGFDCIRYIKFINYIRFHSIIDASDAIEIMKSKVWNDDKYMRPVKDDPFLTFDIESEISCLKSDDIGCENSAQKCQSISDDSIDYMSLPHNELVKRCYELNEKIKFLENERTHLRNLLIEDFDDKSLNVGNLRECEDSYYTASYSHFSIHHEMLSDNVRTEAYRNAILNNSDAFKGANVLDIGCGTGILSLFAAKSGAKLVVAVDHSDIIYTAMDVVRENRLESTIRCIKSRIETINFAENNLPEKYDIIISEWMGYLLLFEGMSDSLIYARDHYLSDNGFLMPNRCTISIAAVSDKVLHEKYVRFWSNVYGWKMTSLRSDVIKEAVIETIAKEKIATDVAIVAEIDMSKCSLSDAQCIVSPFKLISNTEEPITALIGWFNCYFDAPQCNHKVDLSTSPFTHFTHWKQTVFLLNDPIDIGKDNTIEGTVSIKRNQKDVRSLIVQFKFSNFDKKFIYYLS